MMWRPITLVAVFFIALACGAFSCLPAKAQTYPQQMGSSYGQRPGTDALTQQSFGGTSFDDTRDFLARKNEEERETREIRERQRRMMENFTNVPDQLRESYFGRTDTPYNRR